MPPRTRKFLLLVIAGAALFYVAFSFWSNLPALRDALSQADWRLIPLVFALSLLGYALRFANWQFYLSQIGFTKVPRGESALIYVSGFSMSISPGKVGELVRQYLLQERFGIPMARTGSLLVVDRLTDLVALVLIIAVGALRYRYGGGILAVVGVLVIGSLLVLASRPLVVRVIAGLALLKPLAGRMEVIRSLYESCAILLGTWRVFPILLLSLAAWSCEALGFWVVLHALHVTQASIFTACFAYAFSTLMGALTFLPGGIGLTEGSMTGLLVLVGIAKAPAAAATLLIRVATLWFGVILGIGCLTLVERLLKIHPDKLVIPA